MASVPARQANDPKILGKRPSNDISVTLIVTYYDKSSTAQESSGKLRRCALQHSRPRRQLRPNTKCENAEANHLSLDFRACRLGFRARGLCPSPEKAEPVFEFPERASPQINTFSLLFIVVQARGTRSARSLEQSLLSLNAHAMS